MQAQFGARIIIRDCEWIASRADSRKDGAGVHTVDGLSELVSGRLACLLTQLGDDTDAIRVIDPAATSFEQKLTEGFEKTRPFIETQQRQIPPAEARIHLGNNAAMVPVPCQLIPVLQYAKLNRRPVIAGVENSNAELKQLQADRYAEQPLHLKALEKQHRINIPSILSTSTSTNVENRASILVNQNKMTAGLSGCFFM